MNQKLGIYSALGLTVSTALFALGIIIGVSTLSYSICVLLSWTYILFACSITAEVSEDRKGLAYAGIAFASVYAVFIDLVYFTQLTSVANNTVSPEVMKVLSYESLGSLMFNLDLFGYGMLALSTIFIGLALKPANKPDRWLRRLLMIHGAFAPVCFMLPILNIFSEEMGSSGDIIGQAVLVGWCAYFIPVGILATKHFIKKAKQN